LGDQLLDAGLDPIRIAMIGATGRKLVDDPGDPFRLT
jgi:hypothetical protein